MHESFENGDYICEEDIKLVQNYICGNLNSYSLNRFYYYLQYNYVTKLYDVCRWRSKRGIHAIAKKGEEICNCKILNFFADQKHKNCFCSRV